MPNLTDNSPEKQINEKSVYAHKYAIHFDILPKITYLNQEIPIIITDLLQLFDGFPQGLWISQKSVDEGLDFCRVTFWIFSESTDTLKTFGIWFQSIFRNAHIAQALEKIVSCALEEPESLEVELTDWTRLHILESEIFRVIHIENKKCFDT